MDERTIEVRKQRRAILFALAVLVIASSIFVVLRTTSKPVSGDGSPETRSATALNGQSHPTAARERKPVPALELAPKAKVDSPRSRLEQSKDLAQFVLDIKPLLDQNDPSALEAYAAARSECLALSVNPNFADAYRNSTERRIPGYMLDDYVERCRNLASSEKIDIADIRKLRKRAAAGGDMTALAQQFTSQAPSLPADQASKMMRDIVESGDPYAVSELSTILAADSSANFSSFAGSEMYSDAWQLVACDLGMDCGPRSYIVRQMCMFGGRCGTTGGGFREVLSQVVLSPQAFQSAEQTEALIVQAIKNGNFDSIVK
jgi:hypothetical protein